VLGSHERLGKLGVTSRVEAAATAHRMHLLDTG